MDYSKIDAKILFEFDKNVRVSNAELSRQTGIPAETIRYRLNRLIDKEVIKKFLTITSAGALGYTFYKVFLRFQGLSEKGLEELIYKIQTDFKINWLTRITGPYDLGVGLRARSTEELSQFFNQLKLVLGDYQVERIFSLNVSTEFFHKSYFLERKKTQHKPIISSAESPSVKIDKTDQTIIEKLSQDSRISLTGLAEACEKSNTFGQTFTREAISYRLKKLEKNKVILAYVPIYNHEALGQLRFKVLVKSQNVTKEKIDAFVKDCWQTPRIVLLVHAIGAWDYEIDLDVRSIKESRDLMAELSSKHPEVINSYQTLYVENVYQYRLFY